MTTSVYSFFTENLVSEFDLSGCEELIQVFDRQTVGAQLDEEKEEFISNVFTELFFIFEEGKLSLDQLTEFLSRCIKDDLTAEIFCQVLDVLPINTEIASLIDEVYLQKSIIKRSTLVQSTSPDTLLKLANIIPNAASSLNRQLSIRKRDEFYTQKKYNLLHEVSEGYAKLIVEVYQIMRVQATLERQAPYALKIINLLMGHYNLDPNRVLDILIEIFGNQLVDNYVFVLSLLRQSQWWPDVEAVCDSGISELSIGGNETAAKCFGLRFSKMTSDRDLPETFKILLAVLIKEGFISFGSVYKYISDDVDTLEIEYKKDLEDQVFRASASALALAAPLMEEEEEPVNGTTRPSAKDTPSAKPAFTNLTPQTKLEELLQQSQTYQFLRLFLGNGLYYPSIFILTEHPFLALVGEIPVLMNRLTDHVITQFHTPTFSPSELSKLQTPKKVAFSRHNNTIAYDIFPVSSILSFKPTTLSHSSKQFIYFYSEWLTNLPEIKLMVDLVSFSTEFIRFSP